MKLNLASGNAKLAGWVNVDISRQTNPDVCLNLLRYPWPWKTSSVSEIYSSHFLEHIPDLGRFMDECWRVLKPGAEMRALCPYYTSIRAWQDPTHVRGMTEFTYAYFNRDWRKRNGLGHYPISSNFAVKEMRFQFPEWLQGKSHDELEWSRLHLFNTVSDFEVVLEAIKP